MRLDPNIWGPQYWFVLHTIALTYSARPNETIKKKYYDFFHNIPLFLPCEEMGNEFSKILDKYPVTPYLDSRDSLIKWVHFIHNKINISLGKEEIELGDALSSYYENYKPKIKVDIETKKRREKLIFISMIIILTVINIYLFNK